MDERRATSISRLMLCWATSTCPTAVLLEYVNVALIHHPRPPLLSRPTQREIIQAAQKTHPRHRQSLAPPQASAVALTRPLLAHSLLRLRSAAGEGLGGAAGGCASSPVESACVACPPAMSRAHLASDGEQTGEKSVERVPYGMEIIRRGDRTKYGDRQKRTCISLPLGYNPLSTREKIRKKQKKNNPVVPP